MDGQTLGVRKVSVGELYDRLAALDRERRGMTWRWYNIAMRGFAVLFVFTMALVPFALMLNPSEGKYLRSFIFVLLAACLAPIGVAAIAVVIIGLKRAWSPFRRHSQDIDLMLNYERELIADFRQCATEDLKDVAARLDADLRSATRRMNVFAVCVAISSLCSAAFGKDPGVLPHGFDTSLIPWVFSLFVLLTGFGVLMTISMAAQLERMSFILTRAAEAQKVG